MIFSSDLYRGSAAFPWDGRIMPKQYTRFPWLLAVEVLVNGKPTLIQGAPDFIAAVRDHQISIINIDRGAAAAVPTLDGAATSSAISRGVPSGMAGVEQGEVSSIGVSRRQAGVSIDFWFADSTTVFADSTTAFADGTTYAIRDRGGIQLDAGDVTHTSFVGGLTQVVIQAVQSGTFIPQDGCDIEVQLSGEITTIPIEGVQ